MRTSFCRLAACLPLVGLVVTLARAQHEDTPPAAMIVRTMSAALGRIGAAPVTLAPAEHGDFKRLVQDCRAAITVLGWQIGDQAVPADYQGDLMAASLVLARMVAKSTVTADDVAKLRVVTKDLRAKQTWAGTHPDALFGPAMIEPVVTERQAASGVLEVWCCRLLDDALGEAKPVVLARGTTTLALRPGSYAFWLRRRGKIPAEGARREFCADGGTTRIELPLPQG